MKTKTKAVSAISSAIALFGLMLSSCDKKNAFPCKQKDCYYIES